MMVCHLWRAALVAAAAAYSRHDADVVYDFEGSLQGWGSAASSEMQLDVAARGGELLGTVRGGAFVSEPHLDSPPLALSAAGRQTVAIRMKYQGGAARGARLAATYGGAAPSPDHSGDHGTHDWTVRGPPVPVGNSGGASGDAVNDGDASTAADLAAGDAVVYGWRAAEAGARKPTKGAMAHAITDVEIICDAGDCPASLALQAGPSNASASAGWTTFATVAPSNGTSSRQFLATGLSPDARHAFWRVVVSTDARVRELRLLPCVVEARFGISPSPDYVTYVVPLWRRAAALGVGGDAPSKAGSSLLLTKLRLYLGDVALAPDEVREYDMDGDEACDEWRSGDATTSDPASWASPFWRLRADGERVAPWIVSELVMYADRECSAGAALGAHVDAGRAGSRGGVVASAWAGAGDGWALRDGDCDMEDAGGGGPKVFEAGAAAATDRDAGGTFLGYAFERAVAVRCVAICQSMLAANRAESVTLERSDDGGSWTRHATLALPAAATIAKANPCKLSHTADDYDRKRREAYDRSARFPQGGHATSGSFGARDAFAIESIILAYPPLVRSVTGCVDKFWPGVEATLGAAPVLDDRDAATRLRDAYVDENGYLRRGVAVLDKMPWYNGTDRVERSAYGATFACPRNGGPTLTIRGERLGSVDAPVTVSVGGRACDDVTYVAAPPGYSWTARANSDEITCVLPAYGGDAAGPGDVDVVVARADEPALRDAVAYLSYAGDPSAPDAPEVFHVAARSVDLRWTPPPYPRLQEGAPSKLLGALQTTGYVVHYKVDEARDADGFYTRGEDDRLGSGAFGAPRDPRKIEGARDRYAPATNDIFSVTLGNVTTTTIIGLDPDTRYVFAVAAVVEDRFTDPDRIDTVDLYGRRPLMDGARVGPRSTFTNATATLVHDLSFSYFDANATVAHGAADPRSGLGPGGLVGGEGAWGLVLAGSANVEHCNASHACCDAFDAHAFALTGDGCAAASYACVETTARDAFDVEGDAGRRAAPRNDPALGALNRAVAKRIALVGDFSPRTFALPLVPTAACGPAVRLTPAAPRRAGAVWYGRRLNVREGFDTTFVLRPSDPSRRCGVMDGAHTRCRSRGGDGFAFVVQTDGPAALGGEGSGLGHDGLRDAVAVEFDTYYNPELLEPYENHVAVHARGRGAPSSAHHEAALASSARLPDLGRFPAGREFRVVRVVYDPAFDAGLAQLDAFEASPAAAAFLTNGAFAAGGLPDFGAGLGTLSVFVDDLDAPVVVAPLNLDALLSLHHGRAYVGLTAATGLDTWQVHDVLQWNFTMLRKDPPIDMPPVVNGAGSHACAHGAACVHA